MSDSTIYNRIIDYLKGLLSSGQRHELEKEIMRDAFEEEAFEGLSSLTANELETDMANLTARLETRIRPGRVRSLPLYLRIAAVLILLVGLGTLLVMVLRKPSPAPLAQKVKTETRAVPPAPAPADSVTHEKKKIQESLAKKPADKQVLADNRTEPLKMAASERIEDAAGASETGALQARVVDDGEVDELNEVVVVGYGSPVSIDNKGVASVMKTDEISPAVPGEEAGYTKPVPPGGSLRTYKNWVDDKLDYAALKAYTGKYRILVNLTVKTDGTIGSIQIRDSVPDVISVELKRVIAGSPLWQPAIKAESPIEARVAILIILTVE